MFGIHNVILAEASMGESGLIPASLWGHLLAAAVFSALGIFLLWVGYQVLNRVLPFSLRKEIEEDHNMALAVIVAAVIIGMSMIISAAIQG